MYSGLLFNYGFKSASAIENASTHASKSDTWHDAQENQVFKSMQKY